MRVEVLGCRVQGSGFRVQGSGFRVQGSGFRVEGVGCTDKDVEALDDLPHEPRCLPPFVKQLEPHIIFIQYYQWT